MMPGLFCAVAAALGFANLGRALPTVSVTANSTGISWHPSGDTVSTCDAPTFQRWPSIDAANWREGASLYSSWTSQTGTFDLGNVDATGFIPVLQTEDCTLGIQPRDPSKGPFTIGDKDLKTLLGTSLRDYSAGTALGVKGVVKCAAAEGSKADVNWRISKS